MAARDILQQIKHCLLSHYGDRLVSVILYGSEARAQAECDSDIDLLCVLTGPVNTWRETRAITDATYALQLENVDRMFHIVPVSESEFQRNIPLYMEARSQGVAV